jgi:hypothetical protein
MLALCPDCNRHSRGEACAFCGAALVRQTRQDAARLGRAALIVASAATLASCDHSMVQPYGAPVHYEDAGPVQAAPDAGDQ